MQRLSDTIRHRRDDEGAILLLALIFILLVGIVITAVISTTGTTIAASVVNRQYVEKTYAADAGLQFGVQQVRSKLQDCVTSSTGTIPIPAGLIPQDPQTFQPSVKVTCSVVSGTGPGNLDYAIITHDTSSSGITVQGGGPNLQIDGPVFINSSPSSLPLSVSDGDVILGSHTTSCPTAASLGLTPPTPPFALTCTTDGPPADSVTLPTSPPATLNPAPVVDPNTDCAVYSPGKYTSFDLSHAHYFFKSGVYYFDNVSLNFQKQDAFGGTPGPNDTQISSLTPCAVESSPNGYGVKFILGGSSQIISNNPMGAVELFARDGGAASEGTQGVSVMTVPASAGAGWDPSTLGFGDLAVGAGEISGGGGSTFDFISHGYIDAPNALVQIRNTKDLTQYLAGINAGRLGIGVSAVSGGFVVGIRNRPLVRQVKVVSVASDPNNSQAVTITATAVVDVDNRDFANFYIESWRQAA